MVEQGYALAWKQAFHLEKSWKVHAWAARERRHGSEGRAKKESSPFSPIPSNPPTPPPRPPTHAARSLARSRLASFVQMESSLSRCLRRRRMFITEEAWSRARQHQANSTDDITSELSEKDWEPAWGSTIDKRHAWLRISEKGDALAELFVCLFSTFPLSVVTVFRWVPVMTKRGHGGEKLFKCSDDSIFFHPRIISGTRI